MKTASPPLAVAATRGSRIVLADGRELIDGIASWWTACHGYNHPHIRAAVERQLAGMPHVMFGGLVHEQALTLARRLAALLAPATSTACLFQRIRLGRGRSRAEDGGAVLAQPRRAGRTRIVAFTRRLSRRHHRRDGGVAIREGGMHAAFRGLLPQQITVDLPVDEDAATSARQRCCAERAERDRRPSSSSRWCKAPAACAFTTPASTAPAARAGRPLRHAADLR